MRAPDFWSRDDFFARAASLALAPVGWLYGASVGFKQNRTNPWRSKARVVCVGNLTVGGSGKTPVAIAVARRLLAKGLNVTLLSRGYGGKLTGPVAVDVHAHGAGAVGDEPLLLAAVAPTIVSADRKTGAMLADERCADVIVMDDGHQNFALKKDISIVVVDATSGFGNGRVLPAGPLREPVRQGLARADAVVLVGEGTPEFFRFEGPVLRAHLSPGTVELDSIRTVAFAGIGRPEKFFDMLETMGALIVARHAFGDHHAYTLAQIAGLRDEASRLRATLVTTEKDWMRLSAQDRTDILCVPISAKFEPPESLDRLLKKLGTPAA